MSRPTVTLANWNDPAAWAAVYSDTPWAPDPDEIDARLYHELFGDPYVAKQPPAPVVKRGRRRVTPPKDQSGFTYQIRGRVDIVSCASGRKQPIAWRHLQRLLDLASASTAADRREAMRLARDPVARLSRLGVAARLVFE